MTTSRLPITFEFIEKILKANPRSNRELGQLTGYSRCGLRNQLERMELAGLVHRKRHAIDRAAGFCFMWYLGPSSADEPQVIQPEDRPIRGATPRRKTVHVYPLINRRDDLVSALFGPAGSKS